MKKIIATLSVLLTAGASFALAQDSTTQQPVSPPAEQADSLDQLLEQVREGRVSETQENRRREQEFINQRDQQQRLLQEARQTKANEEARSERLERQFQANETALVDLQARLEDRLGNLRELFGVIQQVAGDARGIFQGSVVSAQFPDRDAALEILIEKTGEGSQLPTIEEIEGLWFELQREMTESGRVVEFNQQVVTLNGEQVELPLVRVGDYALVSDGKYFNRQEGNGVIVELPRQPAGRFTSSAADLQEAAPGEIVAFGIDPTRGSLMATLVQTPSLWERIQQGREVGYVIIGIGLLGGLFAIIHFIYLALVGSKVRRQIRSDTPSKNNPLGRVLMVYDENRNVDVETLELKLDEAILRETPALERFLTLIKLISAVAPLLGLLGTVTGMIATFQAITLFGTGDPKLMANGISQALVTTVLGLVVAIPTLLLHSFVSGMSKRIIHILEEQSAGIIAVHAEKENVNVPAE